MYLLQKSKSKVSSRQQIEIKGVKDGVLMLPRNHFRVIFEVSSINFELKSEDEQDALIETYESFLNSIGCPLQILIRTREIDMDKYLEELSERLSGEEEKIYRTQLENYDKFIRSLISTNKILSRHFYIIVPFDATDKIDFDAVREQLAMRTDIVVKGLARLGIQSRKLSSLEILNLFYSFYSPELAKLQPLTGPALEQLHTPYIQKEYAHE